MEDAVQDVLMTVHSIRQTYDPNRPFGPWLVTIAHRRVVDRLRRTTRGLANAGGDTINAVKQAAEFGIQQSGQTMVAFLLFVNDVHGMVPQHRQPTKSVLA